MFKFNKIINLIKQNQGLNIQFNFEQDNFLIITYSELYDIVLQYYQKYYTLFPENLSKVQKLNLGETMEGKAIFDNPKNYFDQYCLDLKHLIYASDQFRNRWNTHNKKIEYILCLGDGHLKGIIKYWHECQHKYPCMGFISIHQFYKSKGYATKLLIKLFQHHKEIFPNQPLLFTAFSDEGQQYIKNKVFQLSKNFNVQIFITDDMDHYFHDIVMSKNNFFTDEKKKQFLNKKYTFPIPEKIKQNVLEKIKKYYG